MASPSSEPSRRLELEPPAARVGGQLSRRAFVQAGAASATAATFSQQPAGLERRDPLSVLVDRATFGFSEATFEEARSLGFEAWFGRQLDPRSIDDSDCDARLADFDSLDETAHDLRNGWPVPEWEVAQELRAARLVRAVYSKRQLLERMVEFWSDHFDIAHDADEQGILKTVDDREVIRAHALGNFRELLHASAKSAAMLSYLDNASNVVGAPNESYAREVMELHTLGVDGPYGEEDVRELARCFTGWTFTRFWEQGEYGTFRFKPWNHDEEAKTVLGRHIPAGGGVSDGEAVLDHLASHPKTADHLAGKLGCWLLGYEPPVEIVWRAAQAFLATAGEIRPMIAVLLEREVILHEPPGELRKFKRPLHGFASMARAIGLDLVDPRGTIWEIWSHGHLPFQWPSPNGFPDSIGAWGQGLIQRWRMSAIASHGWTWSFDVPSQVFVDLLGATPKDQWARRIAQVLRGGSMAPRDMEAVQAYVDSFPNATDLLRQEAFQIALASPSFQYD